MIHGYQNSIRLPTYHVESICAGRMDPFNCLPIPTNLEIDHLVRYLITKFDLNPVPANRRKSWFPYALQNAPMMHSTLAMTAAMWRAESPVLERSIQIEGMRQKGEALRLVRAHLGLVSGLPDSSVADDKDSTFVMSAMSTLVIIEVLDGDFEAAEIHLRGVHNLFSLRGGHDSFRDKWVFCKSTNLADIQVAVALGRQLRFPRLHRDEVVLPSSITNHAQHPPFHSSIARGSSPECATIFTQLRQLLLARQSTVPHEAQLILLNIVDELILQYLYQDQDRFEDRSIPRNSCALVLAAHVFMYVTLRQVPPKSPLIRRICTRLLDVVKFGVEVGIDPTAKQIWKEDKTALLWIAFVGILGTGERTETCLEGQSFLHLFWLAIQEHSRDFSPGTGNLQDTLSAFLWDESSCQPLLAWLEDHHTTT
ncbi:uncharacterized protein GGS22DRAFT_34545 [Annulohypoxylon maeteangense]|uniref:uncharacterized protein n=1 Tax=Annulohypoxylon maeteangense TaxID=1927788 RepID=UPI0020077E97|nr:uncharacterized protein GGS22DRAFT_34545 [Annulohypoxylon maeteangense]KAI0883021.1 hypothetical protein GGS22DRAFT_34545 [Annulohypoxylon maeteangense]